MAFETLHFLRNHNKGKTGFMALKARHEQGLWHGGMVLHGEGSFQQDGPSSKVLHFRPIFDKIFGYAQILFSYNKENHL